MSAVGLQPWPFLVDDGKKTCVRTSSAGSAIIHPNSRSSRRGAFFGAIKIEQNVNFVQSGTRYTFLKLLNVLAQYGIHA